MEFRLIYAGKLPAAGNGNSRVREKHDIRREFHKQLKELYRQSPTLKPQLDEPVLVSKAPPKMLGLPANFSHISPDYTDGKIGKPYVDSVADEYVVSNFRFVPLIRELYGVACSLEILFLRRDNPGQTLVSSGGDLDNRLKVLFDALRCPTDAKECDNKTPGDGETPFHCLLEDDKLITEVSVTTDRLLVPKADDEGEHDVRLIIKVRTPIVNPGGFLAGSFL